MDLCERTIDREYSAEQPILPPRPLAARKGRGAVSNLQGRYEVNGREAFEDGWESGIEIGSASAFKTQVTDEVAKSIRRAMPRPTSLSTYRSIPTAAASTLCRHSNEPHLPSEL